jgi:hypothetical protein
LLFLTHRQTHNRRRSRQQKEKNVLCRLCSDFFSYIVYSGYFFSLFSVIRISDVDCLTYLSAIPLCDGWLLYIYISLFSPPFFGGTPKSHYFFLPLLVDVAGNSSRVMTSRWDSFFLFILQYSAKEDSEGRTSYTCVLALGLTLGCDVLVMPFVHISLRSIANKISIGIFFKVFLFSFEHFFFF